MHSRVFNKLCCVFYDEETGENDWKPVVQLFRNETKEWYHVCVDGEEIVCTGGHPFYVAELDRFVPARELKISDKLLLFSGTCAIIEAIQVEELEKPETTYNFEVDDLLNNGASHNLYTLNGVGHNDFSSLINNSSYLSMLSSAFSTLNTN